MTKPMFKNAIARKPGRNFADGLTTVSLGIPDYEKTLEQHAAYCVALQQCGVEVTLLEADLRYPDSTFVEDAAILTSHSAILTHPGADSRKGEVEAIRESITSFYRKIYTIKAPGTLDGGDICEAGNHFFIGISERTNPEGGKQLADFLAMDGYTASFIPVKGVPNILHLKSGISYLGDNHLVLIDDFVARPDFKDYHIIRVSPEEAYAANCIRVNDAVVMPAGYPKLQKAIRDLGYPVVALDMSEFQKMDGGLSCLSLRF